MQGGGAPSSANMVMKNSRGGSNANNSHRNGRGGGDRGGFGRGHKGDRGGTGGGRGGFQSGVFCQLCGKEGTRWCAVSRGLTAPTPAPSRRQRLQQPPTTAWTPTGIWIPVPQTTSPASWTSSPCATNTTVVSKCTPLVAQVWRSVILVMAFYVPQTLISNSNTFFMFHLQARICFLLIVLPATMMFS